MKLILKQAIAGHYLRKKVFANHAKKYFAAEKLD